MSSRRQNSWFPTSVSLTKKNQLAAINIQKNFEKFQDPGVGQKDPLESQRLKRTLER